MIEVSYSMLMLLPLTLTLAAILLGWLFYTVRDSAWQTPVARARIYRCAVCTHVYVDNRDVPLARCRRCGCLNEAIRR